jgi:hypothetical protein
LKNTTIQNTKYLYAKESSGDPGFTYYLAYYNLTCGMWVIRYGYLYYSAK